MECENLFSPLFIGENALKMAPGGEPFFVTMSQTALK